MMGSCSACFVGSPHPDPDDNGGCFFSHSEKKKVCFLLVVYEYIQSCTVVSCVLRSCHRVRCHDMSP